MMTVRTKRQNIKLSFGPLPAKPYQKNSAWRCQLSCLQDWIVVIFRNVIIETEIVIAMMIMIIGMTIV